MHHLVGHYFLTFTIKHNCYWSLSDVAFELQSQFLLSGLHVDGQWSVPITLCVGSYERQKKFLFETNHGRVDISELVQSIGNDSEENPWIKVNVDQCGFYRVNYEDKLAVRLRKAIQNNCLLPTDKFGVYKVQVIYQYRPVLQHFSRHVNLRDMM